MLILFLVFEQSKDKGILSFALASVSYPDCEAESGPAQNCVRFVTRPELSISTCEPSRPNTLCREMALIYCTSIRLRERNCFRQLKLCDTDLRAFSHGSTCLHIHSTCCQNRSAPYVKERPLKGVQR